MSESHIVRSISSSRSSIVLPASVVHPQQKECDLDRAGFSDLIERLGRAWNDGDAAGAAACFAEAVDYADPRRYRFTTRDELEAFFAPGPTGHAVVWHHVLWDGLARAGVVEYTYVGHHRYHGAAIVDLDDDGLIWRWREWQHRDDEHDWEDYVSGLVPSSDSP